MTTSSPAPTPTAAPRGSVQKTYASARILSGFTDPNHFGLLADDFLATQSPNERAAVLAEAEATRTFVAQLPQVQPSAIVIRDITGPHVDALRAEPLFAQAFGRQPHRFCYIDPRTIIALQAWIEPRSDKVPSEEAALLEFALPRTWDVPAEVSLVPPIGPVQILSSNPAMTAVTVELDRATGKVMISPPKHLNLVQVVHFQGRFFLWNGYHRVADALNSGCHVFPAIVIEGFSPNEAALPGLGPFNIGYVLNLKRPPLVQDFHSAAALTTKLRERRYGVIVNLDIKPLNIGI
jgi:hypothetical protein